MNLFNRKPKRIVIDGKRAVQLLEKAVASRGADYIYKPINDSGFGGCVYVTEDEKGNLTPSCLIGFALAEAGVSLAALEVHNTSVVNTITRYLADSYDVEITDEAINIFRTAQALQDDGEPWGKALEVGKG